MSRKQRLVWWVAHGQGKICLPEALQHLHSVWDKLSGSSQSCLLNRPSNTDLLKMYSCISCCCEDDLFTNQMK